MNDNLDPTYKVLLIGDPGVGKMCLLRRFADGTYEEGYIVQIGTEKRTRTVQVDGVPINLEIWSMPGQERFNTITSSFYRGAHAIIVVYAVTDRTSFENVQKWLLEVQNKGNDNTVVFLLGNKSDLNDDREVQIAEGQDLQENFMEASARNGANIERLLTDMARQIRGKNLQFAPADDGENIRINQNTSEGGRCCY